jgi:hypothetical protein
MGSKVNRQIGVLADWLKPCLAPVASTGEFRRHGYRWFVLDIAFAKSKSGYIA